MINISYAEDKGMREENLSVNDALQELTNLEGDLNIFIDGSFIETPKNLTTKILEDSSYIVVSSAIIGA